jgi:hypothetical protein
MTACRQLKSSSYVCQNRHKTYQYHLYQIALHYCNEKIGIFEVIIGLFNKTNALQRKKPHFYASPIGRYCKRAD